jgi:hypothetical protein
MALYSYLKTHRRQNLYFITFCWHRQDYFVRLKNCMLKLESYGYLIYLGAGIEKSKWLGAAELKHTCHVIISCPEKRLCECLREFNLRQKTCCLAQRVYVPSGKKKQILCERDSAVLRCAQYINNHRYESKSNNYRFWCSSKLQTQRKKTNDV